MSTSIVIRQPQRDMSRRPTDRRRKDDDGDGDIGYDHKKGNRIGDADGDTGDESTINTEDCLILDIQQMSYSKAMSASMKAQRISRQLRAAASGVPRSPNELKSTQGRIVEQPG